MTNHDIHHLAGAYALDALDPEERWAFEAHYPTCDVCVQEVDTYRTVAVHLAEGVTTAPRADLKTAIMGEVATTRQVSPLVTQRVDELAERRRWRPAKPMALAAAAAVVLLLGVAGILSIGGGPSDTERILAASDAVVTSLDGESGSVQVVWSEELDKVAIFGNGLPDSGSDNEFALWAVQEDGVAPAGLFDAADDGGVSAVIDVGGVDPAGWGVTIEPNGGSEQPTGEILFIATL